MIDLLWFVEQNTCQLLDSKFIQMKHELWVSVPNRRNSGQYTDSVRISKKILTLATLFNILPCSRDIPWNNKHTKFFQKLTFDIYLSRLICTIILHIFTHSTICDIIRNLTPLRYALFVVFVTRNRQLIHIFIKRRSNRDYSGINYFMRERKKNRTPANISWFITKHFWWLILNIKKMKPDIFFVLSYKYSYTITHL